MISDNLILMVEKRFPLGKYQYWFVIIAIQIGIIILVLLEQWIPLFIMILFPFMFFSAFNLSTAIYAIVSSLFIGIYLLEQPVGIRVVDILIAITVIAYLHNKAIRGSVSLVKTPLDKPIFLFLGAITISLIGAYSYTRGTINLLRHMELFAIFYVLVDAISLLGKDVVKKLLDYYVYAATFASGIAILGMYIKGEGRAFGITGTPLSDLIVAALIISTSLLILSTTTKQVLKHSAITSILFLELVFTQTRGAWLSFTFALLFMGFLLRNKPISRIYKKYVWIIFLATMVVLIALGLFNDYFLGITHRVEQLSHLNMGTIQYRLILWDAAIQAFLSNQINGIGLGQFALISGRYSKIGGTDLFKGNLEGLTAHNIILSYLAETGFIGILCLLFFIFSCMRLGLRIYRVATIRSEIEVALPLVTVIFFVVVSSFYAGSWFLSINGIQFMFFLALTVVISKKT